MYDSVGLWMPSGELVGSGYKDKIPALLSNTTFKEKSNGNWWITGNYKNLFVSVGEEGFSIKGSPNKFYHGYNFKKLTRQEFELSIEMLSDTFSIDIKQARASSLDVAHNFVMQEPVVAYYPFLGICRYYYRQQILNSLYYRNGLRTLIFYDKALEGKMNGEIIPDAWMGKNVLRFEVRFRNRLLKQFNMASLTARDLYSDEVYIQIVHRWASEYKNIKKNKVMNPGVDNLTCKKAKEILLSALVAKIGQNEIVSLVDGWKDNFTTKKEAQRFKKGLAHLGGLTLESDLIKELDKKINQVKEYYR
ncbi:phage/plasmid replication domain-containing protein [Muriicola sp. Z0-33]|uniref:phage/plasmid replication domain-containing protein n=1 Tax=Muriicola sp. Z0-33 TaxID=2816957 RepID=UPI00223768D5|nr:phage/plasmid replication protein [Muriicola sp. Z0-33]MCW5516155.1 hypothetical protein [Muriicola sp. Z0-33]